MIKAYAEFGSIRTYMSMVDPENQSTYTCKVEDGGDGPTVSKKMKKHFDE